MHDDTILSRQEQRNAARRAQILDAAARIFAEKGYPRATTKEIAAAAEVSEGTIYNYFASKHDLLVGIMAQLAESEHLQERLAQTSSDDVQGFLATMLSTRQQFARDNEPVFKATLSEILIDAHLGGHYYEELLTPALCLIEQHLRARIASGQIRPLDPALAARMFLGLTLGFFILQTLGDPPALLNADDLTHLTTSILFDGLVAANT